MSYSTRKRDRELKSLGVIVETKGVQSEEVDELRKQIQNLQEDQRQQAVRFEHGLETLKAAMSLLPVRWESSLSELTELRQELATVKKQIAELMPLSFPKNDEIAYLKKEMIKMFSDNKTQDESISRLRMDMVTAKEETNSVKKELMALKKAPENEDKASLVADLSKKVQILADISDGQTASIKKFIENMDKQSKTSFKAQSDYISNTLAQMSVNHEKIHNRVESVVRNMLEMQKYIPAYQMGQANTNQTF